MADSTSTASAGLAGKQQLSWSMSMNARQTKGADAVQCRQYEAVLENPALLDVKGVAALLGCSARHIYRLSDGGKMPAPVRLGALVRWRRRGGPDTGIDDWIAAGCPSMRAVKGGPGR